MNLIKLAAWWVFLLILLAVGSYAFHHPWLSVPVLLLGALAVMIAVFNWFSKTYGRTRILAWIGVVGCVAVALFLPFSVLRVVFAIAAACLYRYAKNWTEPDVFDETQIHPDNQS